MAAMRADVMALNALLDDRFELAQLDAGMLLLTFVLAVATSLLAGLLPAWRAMQVTPAVQLKSQ